MNGPGSIMSLVLTEMTVGGLAVLWATPSWGVLRNGYFKLTGTTLAVTSVLAWMAARAPLGGFEARGTAGVAFWLLAATALVTVLWQVLLYAGATKPSRIVGIAAVPFGVGALVAMAALPGASHGQGLGIAQLLIGALFLGAVTDGLLLGHWYLVDKKASRAPLAKMGVYFLAGSILAPIVTLIGGTGAARVDYRVSPLLGVGSLVVGIAVGMAAVCALIAFFIRMLVKEDSIQAATGFFYLAVIMAVASEFAAKVRFF